MARRGSRARALASDVFVEIFDRVARLGNAFRFGYFFEHETKGNRKYFTIGSALKLNVFQIDFAYLIPANSSVRSPLENTMRFSLVFNLDQFDKEKLFQRNSQIDNENQKK